MDVTILTSGHACHEFLDKKICFFPSVFPKKPPTTSTRTMDLSPTIYGQKHVPICRAGIDEIFCPHRSTREHMLMSWDCKNNSAHGRPELAFEKRIMYAPQDNTNICAGCHKEISGRDRKLNPGIVCRYFGPNFKNTNMR